MKFEKIYSVNRKMHGGPLVDVARTTRELTGKNKGLEIRLEEVQGDLFFETSDAFKLLQINPFKKDCQVKIITTGEYPIEKLEKYANEIGGIFEFVGASRPTSEIMLEKRQRDYPDEEPIS